jgi:hypothetical protein
VIIGAHSILNSRNPDADRAFLRDVLGFPNVDVGGGWLIFGLPPSEVAVHPSDENDVHELYLMCDDVKAFIADMKKRGIACGPVQNPGWGVLTHVILPGGGKLGVYEPRHARPKAMSVGRPEKKSVKKRPAKKRSGRSSSRRKAAGR